MHSIPTLIIGGGIAGASLACSLAQRGAGSGAAIVDVDLFGKFGSSELNGGGVRCTFAEPINIRLSLKSLEYYRENARRFDFLQRGYLWMYDQKLWEESREFLPMVRSFGLPVEELSSIAIRQKFPILTDVSDLAGATFTPMDGRLSPHKLRVDYLNQAQAGGVELLDRWQVAAIEGTQSPYQVRMVRIKPRGIRKALMNSLPREPVAREDEMTLEASVVVNCAGPWAPQIAALYGHALPVTPIPRQVFLLDGSQIDLEPLPFFIDYPQDIYFRHYTKDRKSCVLVSWSDPREPHRVDFAYQGEKYYREHVEPRLAKRIAAMRNAALVGGWVGHYELSPDKGAVVGPVPGMPGLYNYNGLSAHGIMQSRGLAEAMAELLLRGRWPADLPLDCLQESRFAAHAPAHERMYV